MAVPAVRVDKAECDMGLLASAVMGRPCGFTGVGAFSLVLPKYCCNRCGVRRLTEYIWFADLQNAGCIEYNFQETFEAR